MAESKIRRTTSADVAREAGLSRATVSYVLNNTPHQTIPEETRRRVLQAAARLRYAPSAAARALRSGRSDLVLCLLPDWPFGPEVGALLTSLSGELAGRGLTFVVHPTTFRDRPGAEIWKVLTPAAVLAFQDVPDDEETAMRAAGVALVVELIGSSRRRRELGVPQQRIGRMQAEHLVATERTRIGYAYPDDDRLRDFADHRLDGARAACADLGLDPPTVRTVPLEPAGAAVAVAAWRAEGIDGICGYNDEVAMAVLAGLRVHGLTAPDHLAVVGVDDIPSARLTAPPLTTVTIDLRTVAVHLAAGIAAAVAGEPAPERPDSNIVRVTRRGSA